jgi:hypothetical protein
LTMVRQFAATSSKKSTDVFLLAVAAQLTSQVMQPLPDLLLPSAMPASLPASLPASIEPATLLSQSMLRLQSQPPKSPRPQSPLQDNSANVAGVLDQAFASNYAANTELESPVPSGTLDGMEWTLPGTDILTPQALALANTLIDQNKFPAGVSPLTRIYRASTPIPINEPLTEQELERLANMTLNRTVTPPPFQGVPSSPEQERQGLLDQDTVMGHIDDLERPDVFMQPPHRSPTPETPLGNSHEEPIIQDQNHNMDSDSDSESSSSSSNSEVAHTKTPRKSAQTSPAAQHKSLAAHQLKSRTIDISSSDEADEADEADDGESEVSRSPSPVAKKKDPKVTQRTADPISTLRHTLGPDFGSKLTLHGSLGSQVSGPLNMLTTPAPPVSECVFTLCNCILTTFPVQMVKEPLAFQYFSLDPTSEAKTHHFFTHENVVSAINVFYNMI